MQISVLFSRVCLFWLFFSQILVTIGLWHQESDVPELFGSPALDRVFFRMLGPDAIGLCVLLVLGILLLSIYLIKERKFGLNMVMVLSGIAYTILATISALLIWTSLPDLYAPPPGLEQLLPVGIVVSLDVIFIVAIRRFIRRHYSGANS